MKKLIIITIMAASILLTGCQDNINLEENTRDANVKVETGVKVDDLESELQALQENGAHFIDAKLRTEKFPAGSQSVYDIFYENNESKTED